jgi:NDP-sugar pyrophosphorylase family protein
MPPALLLSAGLGTRLRPLTLVRAKPALPVAGIPMVRRIISWLAVAGVSDVVLNLHHLPETIASAVGDGADLGVHARYSWEQPLVLGSAGGVRQALPIIGADTFLVVNGDTLTDLDIVPLVAAHRASGALVTMAVTQNTEPQRYSGLRVAQDGAVLGVVPRGAADASCHFIGVQVAHASVFANIPAGTSANSVGDVYDRLIASRPGAIRAHHCDARFWDIGTVADYWHTSRLWASTMSGAPATAAQVGSDAQLTDCIIWNNVEVGARAVLDRCIVTDNVRVPDDAVYVRRILMRAADGGLVAPPFDPEVI